MITNERSFLTSDLDLMLRCLTGNGEARFGVKVDIAFAHALLSDGKKGRAKVLKEFAWLLT